MSARHLSLYALGKQQGVDDVMYSFRHSMLTESKLFQINISFFSVSRGLANSDCRLHSVLCIIVIIVFTAFAHSALLLPLPLAQFIVRVMRAGEHRARAGGRAWKLPSRSRLERGISSAISRLNLTCFGLDIYVQDLELEI